VSLDDWLRRFSGFADFVGWYGLKGRILPF